MFQVIIKKCKDDKNNFTGLKFSDCTILDQKYFDFFKKGKNACEIFQIVVNQGNWQNTKNNVYLY